MYKIFIVEDDSAIADGLSKHLQKWDYSVKCADNFNTVLQDFLCFSPHLVLMDISLPFMNGYYWCTEIRRISAVPVIFISSASDNMNIVMAMNMGADDFIAKPFDLSVLTAKASAILRRAYSFSADAGIIQHGGAMLNLNTAEVTCGAQKCELTKNEFRILQLLLENSGKIVSRDTIMLKLWNSDSFIDDNTLTVNMTRLRKRLEGIGLIGFIKTKKSMGYVVE